MTGHWKIFHLMIDARFQGRGYGSRALTLLMDMISAKPDGDIMLICYHSHNDVARRIYARAGFVEISTDTDGKMTALWRRGETLRSK